MEQDRHEVFLRRTLELARGGRGRVEPNPLVGAVIVRSGEIIATGTHRRYGGLHAEAEALAAAGSTACGATLYCNLEPCAYTAPEKHQPPCAAAVIRHGIRQVVVGQLDPNPAMRGRGVASLRDAGVDVHVVPPGALAERIWRFNNLFNTTMAFQRPMVTLKAAITLDGRIATTGGSSRWITGEDARRHAHNLRRRSDAVVVGIGTVLQDDPLLTARGRSRQPGAHRGSQWGAQPAAVVLDRTCRLPLDSRLVRERGGDLVVCTTAAAPRERRSALESLGVSVVVMEDTTPHHVLPALFDRGMRAVMVEGGAAVTTSFLESGLWDLVHWYVAPIIMGGGTAVVHGPAVDSLADAVHLEAPQWRRIGTQQVVTGYRPGWYEDVHRAC